MSYLLRAGLLLALSLIVFSSNAHATAAQGYAWLQAQQGEGGAVTRVGDSALPRQATAEALSLVRQAGPDFGLDSRAATEYLQIGSDLDSQTEFLARALMVGVGSDARGNSLLSALLARQNTDGGFGDQSGYGSTVYDSALALQTLATVNQADAASRAVAYLLAGQQVDGSWSLSLRNEAEGDVAVSAQTLRGLWHFRHSYVGVGSALERGSDWLLAQRSDDLWASDSQSALALLAIIPTLKDQTLVGNSVSALAAKQLADGSWQTDSYSSALVLQALLLAAQPRPNPDLVTIRGQLMDGDTQLPLSGVELQLSGAESAILVTDGEGRFAAEGLLAGDYSLVIEPVDYAPLSWSASLTPGEQRDLGILELLRNLEGSDPSAAIVRGQVTSEETGQPLVAATVSLVGRAQSTRTDGQGRYQLINVAAGAITVSATKPGYYSASADVTVVAGQSVVFSSVLTSRPLLGSVLEGVMSDKATALPVVGASIELSGANSHSLVTDAMGYLMLENLSEGATDIIVSADGYHSASVSIDVVFGNRYDISSALVAATEPAPVLAAALTGQIVAAGQEQPIAAATITLSMDNQESNQLSDASGQFSWSELSAGSAKLSVSAPNYLPVSYDIELVTGVALDVGMIALQPEGETAQYGFSASLVDSASSLPLVGATVTATWVDENGVSNRQSLTTDGAGGFSLQGLSVSQVTLRVAPQGYAANELLVVLKAGEITALGQIRLRPVDLTSLLPDLRITAIDNTTMATDPASLQLSGQIHIELENAGIGKVATPISLQAFYDHNGNALLDEGDLHLGAGVYESVISGGASASLAIELSGELPFRDASVSVWVDSFNSLVEGDETNNMAAALCRLESLAVGNLDPVVKWNIKNRGVYGPVSVAQLTDDNGDGVISTADNPDIIFVEISYNDLVAVSGDSGAEIWRNKSVNMAGLGSGAVGDIDGDGIVEILFVSSNRLKLYAFEHTGDLKWSSATGPYMKSPRDGLALADIDRDGDVEIIHGRSVFDHHGNKLFEGAASHGGDDKYGIISIAADINLQGDMEIIAGRSAYDSSGATLWENTKLPAAGFNAIGNFDDDDYPEIVYVGSSKVYLLEHTGEIKWGGVALPTGGFGGPPTVADMDGDGEPEIGVAAAGNYIVFETDGSVKWKKPISDYSSNRTGSSVFDFQGDGRAEVVYADEQNFYIYDGSSGDILYKKYNRSGTTLEYPVIADIDNDGQAEILFGGNKFTDYYKGLYALESASNSWMPTRSIWNQHSYHITNINDDGTVPQYEQPSWLTHNSYRLNTFADRDARDTFDLTLAQLRVMDNGMGQSLSLSARIGNAGAIASGATTVDFYRGDVVGGELLGSVALASIAANDFRDITFDGATGVSQGDLITAVVNDGGTSRECGGDNNSQSIVAEAIVGQLSLQLDQSQYAADASVVIEGLISNSGSFTSDYRLQWQIEDAQGALVAELLAVDAEQLASGDSYAASLPWLSSGVAAGDYRLVGQLYSLQGQLLVSDRVEFTLLASDAGGELRRAALAIVTDKPVYGAWDRVELNGRLSNQAINSQLPAGEARLSVTTADDRLLLEQRFDTLALTSRARQDLLASLTLEDAAEGVYRVELDWLSADGELAASDTVEFRVEALAGQALTGETRVSASSIERGQAISCTDSLTNRSARALTDIVLEHLLLDVDAQAQLSSSSEQLNLAGLGEHSYGYGIDSGSLGAGHYACVQQAQVAGRSLPLGYAAFSVTESPIAMDGELALGERGRLLLLIDADGEDPHGPSQNGVAIPTMAEQRQYLQALLTAAGWSYTLVDTAEAFERELNGGGYSGYGLFSEQIKLNKSTQQTLVSKVEAGDGLLAGGHDSRNHFIEPALGIALRGNSAQAEGIALVSSELGEAWSGDFVITGKVLSFVSEGAELIGSYQSYSEAPAGNGHGKTKGKSAQGGNSPQTDNSPQADNAVALYDYGRGRSLFSGFDLLANAVALAQQLAAEGNTDLLSSQNAYGRLIVEGLSHVHPQSLGLQAGKSLPFILTVNNQNNATAGRVVLLLSEGLQLVEAAEFVLQADGSWQRLLNLAEASSQSQRLYIQLPPDVSAGPQTIGVLLQSGQAPDYSDQADWIYSISLQ